MARISVVGGGYVGLVTSACFAELGHQVRCLESDRNKLKLLRSGNMPSRTAMTILNAIAVMWCATSDMPINAPVITASFTPPRAIHFSNAITAASANGMDAIVGSHPYRPMPDSTGYDSTSSAAPVKASNERSPSVRPSLNVSTAVAAKATAITSLNDVAISIGLNAATSPTSP